jgi:MOSC domain-containing protein YiiM
MSSTVMAGMSLQTRLRAQVFHGILSGVTLHHTRSELEAGLDHVRSAPSDHGTLELIVRRPAVDEREVLAEGELHPAEGLVGDTWKVRPSKRTEDGGPHPEMQLNVMNARAALLAAAGDADRRALAGDQLYLDLDISHENLPPGTRLAIGAAAVIEVTAEPHNGCAKFSERFGQDAVRFFNSPEGKALRLRGLNAKVVVPGTIRSGDIVRKVS